MDRAAPTSGGAAAMDEIYRYQRFIYDATRKYYLLGRDRLIRDLDVPPGGSVLEVGCGTGRNLVLAARTYPRAQLYGFDISEVMLETARSQIARAHLAGRIAVTAGNAAHFSMPALFGIDGVDRVFLSYTLSMIPPWQQAIAESYAALKPGGELHIVDFGSQGAWPNGFRGLLRAWLRRFSVMPRDDLESELAALAKREGAALRVARPFRDYAIYARLTKPGRAYQPTSRST